VAALLTQVEAVCKLVDMTRLYCQLLHKFSKTGHNYVRLCYNIIERRFIIKMEVVSNVQCSRVECRRTEKF
jgi:hypothetical protein